MKLERKEKEDAVFVPCELEAWNFDKLPARLSPSEPSSNPRGASPDPKCRLLAGPFQASKQTRLTDPHENREQR
jgi:hypothetical protein